jgi:Glyoxalase/Bleomycin resistance protein/Dioxygenase superfamily
MTSQTSLIKFSDLYHTGIVVEDVDAAKAEYSDLTGVTWGPEGEVDMPVCLPGGPTTVSFRFAYTTQGPHHLELVRQIPGTLWTVSGPGQAHHLGYWCDDVAGASAELTRRGLPLCAKIGVDDPDAAAPFVIHQTRTGAYVELVDAAMRPVIFGGQP